jgi:LmbE family N-acetylglucosaminyl deacetylase
VSKTILFIVAHTDDETLGAGGAIARHVERGDIVYGLSMTDGVSSRKGADSGIELRNAAAQRASRILGLQWLEAGDLPDNAMDSVPLISVVKMVEQAKALVNPKIIYTHSAADLNIDHRVVNHATLTAFRPQPAECWQEIRTFEVPSATDFGQRDSTAIFCPNLYVDIEAFWSKKHAALKEYGAEMRPAPHARSFEGLQNLARYRGNQVGLALAEAFEVIRKIER